MESKKERYDIVFVVLTYVNHDDLASFAKSLEKVDCNYKVIISNSYRDDDSMEKIKIVAKQNKFDFINVKNKGYGYGNNRGIEYAVSKYCFKHLIISNPDIEINKFEYSTIELEESDIIGPTIIREKGGMQNPAILLNSDLLIKLKYYGLKSNRLYFYIFVLLNKLSKKIIKSAYVYSLHGSFFIIPYDTLQKLIPVFDENMFLFNEEDYLGYKCANYSIKMKYDTNIVVYHHEDGSMNLADFNISGCSQESYIYFYERYIKSNN